MQAMMRMKRFGGYSANLIPTMTSNSAPSGVASASAEFSASFAAWKAMDKVTSSRWSGSAPTQWLKYDFGSGNAKKIIQYSIGIYGGDYPTAWTFEGSNDDSAWTTIDTRSTITFSNPETKTYNMDHFTNLVTYRYYLLNVTAASAGDASIHEWAMMDEL